MGHCVWIWCIGYINTEFYSIRVWRAIQCDCVFGMRPVTVSKNTRSWKLSRKNGCILSISLRTCGLIKKKKASTDYSLFIFKKKNPQQKTVARESGNPKEAQNQPACWELHGQDLICGPSRLFLISARTCLSFCHSICPSSHESSPLPPGFF